MFYRCVTDTEKIKEYLSGTEIIAFDFETSPIKKFRGQPKAALDPSKSDITGISFSTSEASAIYIPLKHHKGENVENTTETMKWLEINVFTNPNIIKVAHNLNFEAMFLYARNILISPPYYDTMAAAQMTLKNDTEFRSLSDSGLKTLVPEIYDVDMPTFEEITDGKYFDELNSTDKKTILYACADSGFTLRLYHEFNNWFDKFMPKHREIVEQIESPTAVCIGLMKHNGVLIDKELMLEKQKEAELKIQELKDKIEFITGDINIGVNASTKALKGYLYAKLKLTVLKSTPKYQDSMDDEALILLSDWCKENRPELVELFELIQQYRKWGKIKSTYLDGVRQEVA